MSRGAVLIARAGRAVLPVVTVALAMALWLTTAAYASSCGFLPMSQLVGFAPLQVRFVANQFLPPGSVVWLVDGKPVTWVFDNGRESTEIPTYSTGCFGSCNTIPRVSYTFQSPGYHSVVMQCKSAGSTYVSSEQDVLVLPPMQISVVLFAAGLAALIILGQTRRAARIRNLAAQQSVAAPLPQAATGVQGSMTQRPRGLRSRERFRFRRSQGYAVSTPDPPETLVPGSPPSPIHLESGQAFPIMGSTVERGPRPPGPVENLSVTRLGGAVNLNWDRPDFDPNRDTLLQFQIFRLQYTGHSSAPQEVPVGFVPPNTLSWSGTDVQTSVHSRQDVVGYVVKPVYTSLTGQTQGLQYTGPGSTASIAA